MIFGGVLGFSVEEVGPRVVQAPSSQFCASVSVRGGLDPCSYCLQSTANFSELCAPALCDPALIGSVWLSRSGSFAQFCCGLVFGCTELYGVIYSFGGQIYGINTIKADSQYVESDVSDRKQEHNTGGRFEEAKAS